MSRRSFEVDNRTVPISYPASVLISYGPYFQKARVSVSRDINLRTRIIKTYSILRTRMRGIFIRLYEMKVLWNLHNYGIRIFYSFACDLILFFPFQRIVRRSVPNRIILFADRRSSPSTAQFLLNLPGYLNLNQ